MTEPPDTEQKPASVKQHGVRVPPSEPANALAGPPAAPEVEAAGGGAVVQPAGAADGAALSNSAAATGASAGETSAAAIASGSVPPDGAPRPVAAAAPTAPVAGAPAAPAKHAPAKGEAAEGRKSGGAGYAVKLVKGVDAEQEPLVGSADFGWKVFNALMTLGLIALSVIAVISCVHMASALFSIL